MKEEKKKKILSVGLIVLLTMVCLFGPAETSEMGTMGFAGIQAEASAMETESLKHATFYGKETYDWSLTVETVIKAVWCMESWMEPGHIHIKMSEPIREILHSDSGQEKGHLPGKTAVFTKENGMKTGWMESVFTVLRMDISWMESLPEISLRTVSWNLQRAEILISMK